MPKPARPLADQAALSELSALLDFFSFTLLIVRFGGVRGAWL